MIRPTAIGLAPNLEEDDIFLAIKNILLGRIIINSQEQLEKLKEWFKSNYGTRSLFLFNSARSALFLALKSLNVGVGDEVIVPAFTCIAVPNAVLWTGAKAIFVDIDKKTLGIDIKDLEKKISKKTKAIIVQYTFGIPVDILTIKKIAQKYNITVIEDCAHGIKIPYNNKFLGQFGDMAVFSFGRDKAVSSVFGGVLIVNNQNYNKKLENLYNSLKNSSLIWIFKQHFHSIIMGIVLPTYNMLALGKLLLLLSKKLGLITMPVYEQEKIGKRPLDFPAKFHSSLAVLALNQLSKLDRFNSHRSKIVNLYTGGTKNEPLLRYPVLVKNKEGILKLFKKQDIILGNWYSEIFGVTSCPTSKYVAQHIINLPTYPTLSQNEAQKIINLLPENELL